MNRFARFLVVLPAVWYFNIYDGTGHLTAQQQYPTAKECTTQANDYSQVLHILGSNWTVSICQKDSGGQGSDINN